MKTASEPTTEPDSKALDKRAKAEQRARDTAAIAEALDNKVVYIVVNIVDNGMDSQEIHACTRTLEEALKIASAIQNDFGSGCEGIAIHASLVGPTPCVANVVEQWAAGPFKPMQHQHLLTFIKNIEEASRSNAAAMQSKDQTNPVSPGDFEDEDEDEDEDDDDDDEDDDDDDDDDDDNVAGKKRTRSAE